MTQDDRTVVVRHPAELTLASTRRRFLQALGVGGTIVLLPGAFAACTKDPTSVTTATTDPQTISLATDTGILNFALVLEQLEASFYTQVIALGNYASLFSAADQEILTDIRNDEVVHREFLRAVLGSNAVPVLTFDFSTVAANRTTLLQTALALETTGISAYNGAGASIKDATNLLLAGKIVSVEARHTSALADALDTTGTAYADLTASVLSGLGADNTKALDAAATPQTVLGKAQPFIKNTITLA